MKRLTKIVMVVLMINILTTMFSGCGCDEMKITSVELIKKGDALLDCRIIYNTSELATIRGFGNNLYAYDCEKMTNSIDTSTIEYSVNKQLIIISDTIPANENLWTNQKTKQFISYSTNRFDYSDITFNETFYNNLKVESLGMIITFKAKTNDNIDLNSTLEN